MLELALLLLLLLLRAGKSGRGHRRENIETIKTYLILSGRSTWLLVLFDLGGNIVEAWPSWTLGSRAPPSLNRCADDCRGAGDSCNEDMEPQL